VPSGEGIVSRFCAQAARPGAGARAATIAAGLGRDDRTSIGRVSDQRSFDRSQHLQDGPRILTVERDEIAATQDRYRHRCCAEHDLCPRFSSPCDAKCRAGPIAESQTGKAGIV
jgi:hypothetical protein